MAISSLEGLSINDPQVFINFRGSDLQNSFISFLVTALRNANINVFVDRDELMGTSLQNLLVRIEESKLAIAIFSENYTSSVWCLDELVKIKECMDQRGLIAVPIFYKIEPSMVKHLEGKFGDGFRTQKRFLHEPEKIQKWEEALTSITQILGGRLPQQSDLSDEDFIKRIVEGVQRSLGSISITENPSTQLNFQENQSSEIVVYESKKDPTLPEVYRSELGFTARELEITSSDNPKKWTWSSICDASTNHHNIEIVTMKKIHWLEINGSFNTSNLSPGTAYEVFFVVRLEGSESGWKNPVTLTLKVEHHDGNKTRQESEVKLANYLDQDWVNIRAGTLVASDVNAAANVYFSMFQLDFQRKGLVVQGVAIRPIH